MSNENFFKHDDKAYAENLNDAVLIGNAFNFEVPVNLPSMYLNNHFPTDTNVHKAGVADVTIISSGSLSIGDTEIRNNTNTSQILRLRIYPNFNTFHAFKSINWTCTGNVTVDICNVGTTTSLIPSGALTNPDNETLLNGISSLQGLKEYDLLITIPVNGVLNTLSLVFVNNWNSQNRVSASISQDNVTGLTDDLSSLESGKADTEHSHTTSTVVESNALSHIGTSVNALQSVVNEAVDEKVGSLITSITNMTDTIYPIGAIYMSVNNTNPSALFGGTWERIKDRFLLSAGDTYSNGTTGGEATHTLTINEIPSHSHRTGSRASYSGGGNMTASVGYAASASTGSADTSYTGGGQAHNNMPPYIAVYVWKRTA